MNHTIDRQIDIIREMGRNPLQLVMKSFFLALAVLLLIAGMITENPPYYMVAAFSGLVALSAFQTVPHISNAVSGLDKGTRKKGAVTIRINRWTDSDAFHAFVHEIHDDHKDHEDQEKGWAMEFLPQGWMPEEGACDVERIDIGRVKWPVLMITDKGVILPRYTPKKLTYEEFSSTHKHT